MATIYCTILRVVLAGVGSITALQDAKPSYLARKLTRRQAVHGTRSGVDETTMKNQPTKFKLADRRFSVAATVAWNAVPQNIRSC